MRSRPFFLFLVLVPWGGAQAQPITAAPGRTISVSGAADVKVKPDHIILTLGVETKRPSLEEAKRENDDRIQAVIAFLKSSGLSPGNIQTDYIAIQPSYQWDHPTVVSHFTVQKTIVAVLNEPSKFESILNGSVSRGITTVQGAAFRTSELKRHRETARELAVKAALEKATKLASHAGAKPGKVLSLSESSSGGWSSWYPGSWGSRSSYGGGSQVSYTPAGSSASSDDSPQTLALGEIVVSASVYMTLQLE